MPVIFQYILAARVHLVCKQRGIACKQIAPLELLFILLLLISEMLKNEMENGNLIYLFYNGSSDASDMRREEVRVSHGDFIPSSSASLSVELQTHGFFLLFCNLSK